jgi:hypothetical protein
MSNLIEINNVDVNLIELRPSKGEKKQGKMFNVFHDGKRLEVILPEMDAPFGAKVLTDFGDKVSIALSFNGINEENKRGERLQSAHAKLIEIQEKIHALILSSPKVYFKDKKAVSMDVLKDRVKNFVFPSFSKDGKEYADIFRTEIQRYNPNTNPGEKDANKTPEELEALRKTFVSKKDMPLFKSRAKKGVDVNLDTVSDVIGWGTRLKPVVSFAYVWIMNSDQKCTPKWYITHAMITADASRMEIDLNPDEEEDEEEEEEEEEMEYEENIQAQAME